MSDLETIKERNRELARRINEEALANPNSPYAGKFVGIANGQVVCAGDDLTEVANCVRAVESDGQRTFFIEAGLDYDEVHEIWCSAHSTITCESSLPSRMCGGR